MYIYTHCMMSIYQRNQHEALDSLFYIANETKIIICMKKR